MRYKPLHQDFYIRNRKRLIQEIEEDSIVLLTSNDEYPRCGDTTHQFRQNSPLLYLCGIDQEETCLALAPWHPDPNSREVLFIKNPSPEMITWFGHRLSKEQASAISGIKNVVFIEDFESTLNNMLFYAKNVYLHLPESSRSKNCFPTREVRMAEQLKKDYPLHNYRRLASSSSGCFTARKGLRMGARRR